MLFSLKHTLFFTLGAFTLLQSTIARPVVLLQDEDLIKCEGAHGSELRVRSEFANLDLLDDPKRTPYRPGPTRLTLGHEASTELNNLGLHGKARKNTIKWHKKQMHKAMRTHPTLKDNAHAGVIVHLAHKGGSNPNEKNHITATFTDKHGHDIHNTFNNNLKHHIYVSSSNKGLPGHVKGAMNGVNARLRRQSRNHQVSSGKTRTPGKSRTKGKGKSNPGRNFSKQQNKGFKRKGGK